jgi:YfiH family protein
MTPFFIQPHWPAPAHIKAYTTTRLSGDINTDREQLKTRIPLPEEPVWLRQTHSIIALPAQAKNRYKEADASFSDSPRQICAVLTADCLPILLCHHKGTHVAAIHAGWRGLVNGIIESTLAALNLPPDTLLAWLGPAISAKHYIVGDDVRDAFLNIMPYAQHAFTVYSDPVTALTIKTHWHANLYELARLRLQQQGVKKIYGGDHCTFSNQELFYSYRRDEKITGRIASLIWISSSSDHH